MAVRTPAGVPPASRRLVKPCSSEARVGQRLRDLEAEGRAETLLHGLGWVAHEVDVAIDHPGHDREAGGVEDLGVPGDRAVAVDGGDPAVLDDYCCVADGIGAGAVDEGAAADCGRHA
jgi:hypothetical protein